MDSFNVGDRVVVKGFRENDPNPEHWSRLVGHYGHIKRFSPGRGMPIVKISGCIEGPMHEGADWDIGWAFYPEELEHAD